MLIIDLLCLAMLTFHLYNARVNIYTDTLVIMDNCKDIHNYFQTHRQKYSIKYICNIFESKNASTFQNFLFNKKNANTIIYIFVYLKNYQH